MDDIGAILQDPGVSIEHVGSTAVAGMTAKPVIDLLVGADSANSVDRAAGRLRAAGWHDLGEAGVPGRRYLRRRTTDAVNIHIVLRGGEHWINNLVLRDYLRCHPDEAAAYGRLKREIIQRGHDRLLAYSVEKAATMKSLVGRARLWAKSG